MGAENILDRFVRISKIGSFVLSRFNDSFSIIKEVVSQNLNSGGFLTLNTVEQITHDFKELFINEIKNRLDNRFSQQEIEALSKLFEQNPVLVKLLSTITPIVSESLKKALSTVGVRADTSAIMLEKKSSVEDIVS